jgi:hypothetical protein
MNEMNDENLGTSLIDYNDFLDGIKSDVEDNFQTLENKISLMEDNLSRKKLKLAQGAFHSYQLDFQKFFKVYLDSIMLLETHTNDFRLKLLEIEKIVNNIDKYKSHLAEFKKITRMFLDNVNSSRDAVIDIMENIDFSALIYLDITTPDDIKLIENVSKFNNTLTIKLRELKNQLKDFQEKIDQLRLLKDPIDQLYKNTNLK